ncbi:VITF-3 subunit protein [Salmon gill poxvirus]|uniref:Intermediate transcription factor 3 small subunit n=1 Tax=Salmon gill poxvirus TaxID=1680908 RepID=A0A0H4Y149_9POXV|nr:VITF-3 subunit protein [Salmon gill poxvirus]AKR04230.1 VITF-3 subunit protein [Salmon gill poxvirus]WMX26517.1 VITF-3 subunit protein [Salmon gill poxvirus]
MDSLSDIFDTEDDVFIDDNNHFVFEKEDIDIEQTIGINEHRDRLKFCPMKESHGRYYVVISKSEERSQSLGFFNHRKRFVSLDEEFKLITLLYKLQNVNIIKKNNIISSIYLVLLYLLSHNIVLADNILLLYFIEICKIVYRPTKLKLSLMNLYSVIKTHENIEIEIDENTFSNYPNGSISGLVRGFVWDIRHKLWEVESPLVTAKDNLFLSDTDSFLGRFESGLCNIIKRLYSANTKLDLFGSNIKKHDMVGRLIWRTYQTIINYIEKYSTFEKTHSYPLSDIHKIKTDIFNMTPKWDYFWSDYKILPETSDMIRELESLKRKNVNHKIIQQELKNIKIESYKKWFENNPEYSTMLKNKRQRIILTDDIDFLIKTEILFGDDFVTLIKTENQIVQDMISKSIENVFGTMEKKHASTFFGFKKKVFGSMDIALVN